MTVTTWLPFVTPLEVRRVDTPSGPQVWVRVRDPNGQSGWMKESLLAARRP